LAVEGQVASPTAAAEEMNELPPAEWSWTKQYRIGWQDAEGALAAMANVTSDLLATGVWHIGLFIVASARHGTGDAQRLYGDLERWAADNGARWLRLGVVAGNGRAERFWERAGFREIRHRPNMRMGQRTNTVRVMLKALRGDALKDYLQLVPRDRPDEPG
jgi:GNAT superfamily N-acetyltransferase